MDAFLTLIRVVTYDLSSVNAGRTEVILRKVWSGGYYISYYWHCRSAIRRGMVSIRSILCTYCLPTTQFI